MPGCSSLSPNTSTNVIIEEFCDCFDHVKKRLNDFCSNRENTTTLEEVKKVLFRPPAAFKPRDEADSSENMADFLTLLLEQKWVYFDSEQNDELDLNIFSKNHLSNEDNNQQSILELLNKAAARARIILNTRDRQAFFEELTEDTEEAAETGTGDYELTRKFRLVMYIHMGMFLSREYSNKLSQFSEICNTLAYNRAETGLHFEYAYQDSAIAVGVMSYLLYSAPPGSLVRRSFEQKLAQFLDTFGWVRYRHFHAEMVSVRELKSEAITNAFKIQEQIQQRDYDISRLAIAEEYLQRGLRYDRQRAIIHYHLARLYLTRVEALWQRFPQIQKLDANGMAPIIDTSITQSFRYLRNARQFDQFNRLHAQLSWLNNRLQMYKIAWEKRQFRGIAGDNEADSPFFRQGGVFSVAE